MRHPICLCYIDFKGFFCGFSRPGRSPHQALDALTAGIQRKRVKLWVLFLPGNCAFGELKQGIARLTSIPYRTAVDDHCQPGDPQYQEISDVQE